jgi:predicted AlkP superfamily phosphohydrolase/phosphomutase
MMVVFQEMHHAGHYLWHTLGPNDHYPDLPAAAFRLDVGIDDIYAAIDDEIGILLDAMPDASVFVVSLNGMDFYRGTPLLLGDALRRWGMASLHGIATSGWSQRLRMVLAGAKSRSPHWLKHLYQRGVSRSVRLDLARSTLLEPFDWGSTRAFPVPPEENSYIRINLAGREAQGTVTASELPRVIDEICERLEALRAEDGSPAVRKLFRPGGDRSASPVPDIIVHWNHETTFPPGRIGGLPRYRLAAPHHTGHHRPLGFCITSTTNGETPPATVATTDLHRWIEAAVTGGT